MQRITHLLLLIALVGSITAPAHADDVVIHNILPSDTDPRINTYSGDGHHHQACFQPTAKTRNQLVIFLPGTGGKGPGSLAFNTLAAREGYHLVSLAYPDDVSMSKFHESDDPDAFAKARENILFGKTHKVLNVSEPNSILNRAIKAIEYLAKHHPKQHWDQYLTEQKTPAWDKIVLAGHSQGGGHAAYLAMQHRAARVLMFGSPKDFNTHFNKPAKWYSGENATPLDRYFSFVHKEDTGHGCTYPQQLENYHALKLMPTYSVVDVDQKAPPYEHTRLLTSSVARPNPHGAVIANKEYLDAWMYLLTEVVK